MIFSEYTSIYIYTLSNRFFFIAQVSQKLSSFPPKQNTSQNARYLRGPSAMHVIQITHEEPDKSGVIRISEGTYQ